MFEDDEYLINVAKDVIIHIHNFGVPIKTNAVMWITSDSGVCIYAYIKIISAILGELTQVTISTYPGKGKQTREMCFWLQALLITFMSRKNSKQKLLQR